MEKLVQEEEVPLFVPDRYISSIKQFQLSFHEFYLGKERSLRYRSNGVHERWNDGNETDA